MNWLHPDFVLIEPEGGRVTAAAIEADSATLIPGDRLVLARPGVRRILAGLLACELCGADLFIQRDPDVAAPEGEPGSGRLWLQTSGSTGRPRWAAHDSAALRRRLSGGARRGRWLLTYAPGSFAGLQVILSAALGGHELVEAMPGASVGDLAALAHRTGVSHIGGTPSFWRAFLMALGDRALNLAAISLGGEVADQPLLDALRTRFPAAHLRHIYATTETGMVFTVGDGRAGFPAAWLEQGPGGLRLAVSARGTLAVALGESWIDTGDGIAVEGDRALFRGRLDSMVNIGGVKIWPEEVEAHLRLLPCVADVLVSARANPVTGFVLVAQIVLAGDGDPALQAPVIKAHLAGLPRAARPAMIRYRTDLTLAETGKKARIMDPMAERS